MNGEVNMTSNSLANLHSSLINNGTNLNSFPTNLLEVHRILATHMLMMGKHRRLFHPASEANNDTNLDKVKTIETDASSDDLRREDAMKHFLNSKGSNRSTAQSFVDSNSYRPSFQSVSKTTVDSGSKAFLEHAKCYLETKELWEKFHRLGTEMIITKTGR